MARDVIQFRNLQKNFQKCVAPPPPATHPKVNPDPSVHKTSTPLPTTTKTCLTESNFEHSPPERYWTHHPSFSFLLFGTFPTLLSLARHGLISIRISGLAAFQLRQTHHVLRVPV